MSCSDVRKLMATALVVAVVSAGTTSFAAPGTAVLTGSVYGEDVSPLAGAIVKATDATGATLASAPTAADGTFTLAGVAAGRQTLTVATDAGAYEVATPIQLAPGETRTVRMALRRAGDDDEKEKKKGGAYWTGGAKGGMIAVLVGFVAAGAIGISQSGDDEPQPAASPYTPPEE